MEKVMPDKLHFFQKEMKKAKATNIAYEQLGPISCENGKINNSYPCNNVNLVGFLPYTKMQAEVSRVKK